MIFLTIISYSPTSSHNPAIGGALSDTAIGPSVCLSHGAAALGYRHAGCLQLSHRRPPEICGRRTRLRTDVDPPLVELAISSRRPRGDNLLGLDDG